MDEFNESPSWEPVLEWGQGSQDEPGAAVKTKNKDKMQTLKPPRLLRLKKVQDKALNNLLSFLISWNVKWLFAIIGSRV